MVIDLPMTRSKSNSERDTLADERVRAEDILLGSLGFGEEAQILSIVRVGDGYRGRGRWVDGEEFEFESEEPLDTLERWALSILEATHHH